MDGQYYADAFGSCLAAIISQPFVKLSCRNVILYDQPTWFREVWMWGQADISWLFHWPVFHHTAVNPVTPAWCVQSLPLSDTAHVPWLTEGSVVSSRHRTRVKMKPNWMFKGIVMFSVNFSKLMLFFFCGNFESSHSSFA